MTEKLTKSASSTNTYSAKITELAKDRVLRYRLILDSRPLSWFDVVGRWQNDHSFRCFFISILVDAPFPAYFWETPPITSATTNQVFEFVLVDSPQLAGVRPNEQAFASYFASARSGASVVEFANLGGDAHLVVPCPQNPLSAYSQLATFARRAPDDQQHQLWILVGAALERALGAQPVWLNTSGLGIYWLHIRLDSTPKYYTHGPYKHR